MKLFLFRHGLAAERDEFIRKGIDDVQRPLVEKGRQRTVQVADKMKDWLDDVDIIVSSPYLRAKQTAALIKKTVQSKKYVEAVELIPSAPPIAFAEWLRAHASEERVVIAVGHSPQLDLFASWCLSGALVSFIDLKKSGVILLEFESFQSVGPNKAELKLAISPKLFE